MNYYKEYSCEIWGCKNKVSIKLSEGLPPHFIVCQLHRVENDHLEIWLSTFNILY